VFISFLQFGDTQLDRRHNGDGNGNGSSGWTRVRIALVGVVFVASLTLLLIVPILPTGQVAYAVGDVARSDIRAPRHLEFKSQIQTQLEQDRAAAAVADRYDPPENRVARQQIARAHDILAYMASVRNDIYATGDQQIVWIQAIPEPDLRLALTPENVRRILAVQDSDWAEVRDEVVRVLAQAMRQSIRGEDLVQARARVHTLVDWERMDDEQVALVSMIVRGLVVPNTFINVEETEAARQKAREAIEPVSRSYEAGEIVLREGDTIAPLDLEALDALGLLQSETDWRDVAGAAVLVLLATAILALSLFRYQPNLLTGRSHRVALVALLFIFFVVIAKFMVPGRAVLPYLYPAAALSMVVTVIMNPEVAIVFTLVLATLVGYITGDSLELATYIMAGGLISALLLRRIERVNGFFRAGIYVGLTNVITVLVFRLPDSATDTVGLFTLTAMGLVNGALVASLALAVFFLVGNLFDITTSLKLLELSQPSHPLLRQLLLKAPGTYHHTLMIANLAEEAAERIGANALLTRVGAFYHDIGKTRRPGFFTENQMGGPNPHDNLDPYTSAEILRGHVTKGLELARQYRLPSRVRAFISEHHGDGFISFMYQRAVEEAGGDASQVDEQRFRYAGPKPQSKETALVMLADTTEAMAKSKRPGSPEELEDLVDKAISMRREQGQLDECDLTLHDLLIIRQSFVDTLKGLYHTRIEYPEPRAEEQAPALPVPSQGLSASFVQAFARSEAEKQEEPETVAESSQD
jgi:putative nucleotidyltransferase with HDIG domain